jgi:hypothetical protein
MARFFDVVGYGDAIEEPSGSGVWVDDITEVSYYGDIIRNTKKSDVGEGVNDNITVNNSISIVADDFANENFLKIKYVRWSGVLWTVTSVEVKSPRLILSLGSVYNGPTA